VGSLLDWTLGRSWTVVFMLCYFFLSSPTADSTAFVLCDIIRHITPHSSVIFLLYQGHKWSRYIPLVYVTIHISMQCNATSFPSLLWNVKFGSAVFLFDPTVNSSYYFLLNFIIRSTVPVLLASNSHTSEELRERSYRRTTNAKKINHKVPLCISSSKTIQLND